MAPRTTRRLYEALVQRDPRFEGRVVVGVKTTGIFCRLTCAARKPRIENVRFFTSTAAAAKAGFRACKRCKPTEAPGLEPAWVKRVLGETARRQRQRERRVSNRDLRGLGVDPNTARRWFRDHLGMSFQAWQRQQRLGLALEGLARGEKVMQVGFHSGFESESGFREAFMKVFGVPPGRAREKDALVATLVTTPIGPFIAGATEEGVCLFEFADRPALLSQTKDLRRWFPEPIVPGTNQHLERLRRQVEEYFAAKRQQFDVPLLLRGTPFQIAVWESLLRIPCGETRSYEDLARAVKSPKAVRAVGTANGKNRIAVLVPCHRVINKDGGLGGYGGSLWRKRFLLELERTTVTKL